MFWRAADSAGVTGDWRERLGEATWIAAGLAGAIGVTALLGAECAMLAGYVPLIVLRFLLDERPSRDTLADTARRMWPFAFLLGWLSVSRLVSPLAGLLGLYRVQPFAAGPAWVPFFHAGTWLVVTAIVVAAARGQAKALGRELGRAWETSRLAILSVIAFSIMAELLAGSGIASAFAGGLYGVFGPSAVAVTSLVSAVFGALANSGSAPNGLFMASQISLAHEARLDVPAVVALQYAAALSLNIISPVRMSIVCGLANLPGLERAAWRAMLPFVLAPLLVLAIAAALICDRYI